MSQEIKDVCVCFCAPLELSDALLLTHTLLQPFPSRSPPQFRPWFPSDTHRALRPLRPPPVLCSEGPKSLKSSESHVSPKSPEGPKSPVNPKSPVSPAGPKSHGSPKSPAGPKASEGPQRSWCVMGPRGVCVRSPDSLSGPFLKNLQRMGIDPRHRVRWELEERHCSDGTLERLWLQIMRCVRHARLPSCNAHFQRESARIRLYCDAQHSHTIGLFLKQELQLSGEIPLTTHRLGLILHF